MDASSPTRTWTKNLGRRTKSVMRHAFRTAERPTTRRPRPAAQQVARARLPAFGRANPGVVQRHTNRCACGGSCPHCQAKSALKVGAPDDGYERDADAVADRVVRMKSGDAPLSSAPSTSSAVESDSAAPASVDSALRSPGHALDADSRAFFEPRFGHDFSPVRIHTGAAAGRSATDLGAAAYTVGRDIVFGAGRFAPGTHEGRRLLAHELTHVVQQSHGRGPQLSTSSFARVQRSCSDGGCDTCAGGRRDFWITVFFRRRATQDTMTKLRTEINGAKAILANCCLNLKFDFNWSLLPGGGSLPAFEGDPLAEWHYTPDEQDLGEGVTFSGARGIPMLLVDDVPLSGGGITVDPRFDTTYTGRSYFAIGINQTTTPNPACNHIAHELWHVGSGSSAHDPANGTVSSCSGAGVSPTYCDGLRALA